MQNDTDNARLMQRLRAEYPAFRLSSDLVRLDDTGAVVRVDIVLPAGGSASALGSARSIETPAVEMAESRALTRALSVLGLAEGVARIEEPVSVAPEAAISRSPAPTSPVKPAEPVRPAPIIPDESPDFSGPEESAQDQIEEPQLEDYSWTSFWQWARKIGFQNKVEVEKVIGESITSLNPAQVRNLLKMKTGKE